MDKAPLVLVYVRSRRWPPMEDNMIRNASLIAAPALALVFCFPVRGQDSPSLGDVARQAQKNKTARPAAKVITNDDMPSGSSASSYVLGAAPGQAARPAATSQPAAEASPEVQLAKLDSMLRVLDSLDSATLARNVLQGSNADFPGRAKWEERLFAAKQTYVVQGRALIQKARQIAASAENLKGTQDPNDPRVKNLSAKLQELVRDGVQMGASFEAVMMEGRDLAGLPSSR
jgi:hypothetical protein